MASKATPALLLILLGGCSAIVNPSGAPFDEDGGVPLTDAATDTARPPGDSGPTDSAVDTSVGDSGPTDSAVDTSVGDSGPTDSAVDSGSGCTGSCDDGVSCTVDTCVAGTCQHERSDALCDDGVSCTVDRCSATDDCINTPNNGLCDGGFCFSGASCSPSAGGCVGGTTPRDCLDGDACTSDTCDAAAMACVHDPRDDDGDGFPVRRVGSGFCAGGTDCDDTNPNVHPGAAELCNSRDDNCDGRVDEGCSTLPDDCGSARAITLSGGQGSASGSFGSLSDDYRTTCGQAGGRDAVYYVDVTALSDITIDTLGLAADTVLSVTTDCPSLGSTGANACNDDIDSGAVISSRMWLHRWEPRGGSPLRVYILVDGFSGGATGSYQVNVRVAAAHADTCTAPIDITGGGTLVGVIGGLGAILGPRGSCQDAASFADAEAVATFAGSASGSAEFDAFSRNFVPDLYVRSSCGDAGSELDCEAGGLVGGRLNRAQLTVGVTTGSRYLLFVDGATAGGAYSVTYQP